MNLIRIIFLICCLWQASHLLGQNLVPNAGFEDHHEFEPGFSPFYWGISHLKQWTETGGMAMISYCFLDLEKRTDTLFKKTSCCGNTINPHQGKGMVKLSYIEACGIEKPLGCATYLKSKFISPLVVGNIYEVSMWVYFPEDQSEDTTIYTNIGMYLSLQPETIYAHTLLQTDYFFSDTIPVGRWFQIKNYIRALCPLQHLLIGVVRNEVFPKLHRQLDIPVVYFIDDVNIAEIAESDIPTNIQPTPFCNYFQRREKIQDVARVDEMSIYFNTNEAILDANDQRRLDSFFLSKEGNADRAFVINGYTDDEGTDNMRLSLDRANAVKDYYKTRHNLQDHLFIHYGQGIDSLGNNKTDRGRQLNRRVTIQNSNITSIQALYRKGLEYASNNEISKAAGIFKKWIAAAPLDKKIQILHDPRLAFMQKLPVWSFLVNEVRKEYNVYLKAQASFFLDSMYFVDQRYRTFTPTYLSGLVENIDTFPFSREEKNKSMAELIKWDSLALKLLQTKFLNKNPFPKISHVGRRQARAVGYIIIHNQDSTLMKQSLPLLEDYCLQGEAEWDLYAIMFDQLQRIRNLPQHYGTVYIKDKEKNTMELYRVDDMEKVIIRRRRLGMGPQ